MNADFHSVLSPGQYPWPYRHHMNQTSNIDLHTSEIMIEAQTIQLKIPRAVQPLFLQYPPCQEVYSPLLSTLQF